MSETLKKRSEIPVELTWDLTKLFTNDESCRRVIKEVLKESEEFHKDYEDRVKKLEGDELVKAIREYEKILGRLYRTGTYSNLRTATDMSDTEAMRLMGEFSQSAAQIGANIQFFQDELADLSSKKLDKASELAPEYETFLADIAAWQKHMLKPSVEIALAKLSPILGLPNSVYDISKAADMRFPDFDVNGKSYPMSYVLYESHYCEHPDTDVRRAAFKAFSEHLLNYHHINATIYNAQVQQEKTLATMRGFDSVFDYLLFHQKVSREQYDKHLDITMERLAPIMQRWAKLIQKKHNLDEMRYSDLKLVLMPENNPNVTIEEAQEHINNAMAIMGEDYQKMVMRFPEERWIDFARNEGKSTGGFCTVPNNAQPYVLLNWNDSFSELYTLAHELGHAAQGLLCEENNSLLEADFTWYDVEAPSTFHEMLLSYSLRKKAQEEKDEAFESRVLSAMIENTYYHNFVTHFLEAYYQREVYRMVDEGKNVQADDLDRIFKETLEKFWGDAVILDEGAELTWMRQPHYYNGLYSYTYSASLVISTQMYKRLLAEGESVVEDWIKFLSTGGPMAPLEHAKLAKIDISNEESLNDTIDFIGSIISDLEKLA